MTSCEATPETQPSPLCSNPHPDLGLVQGPLFALARKLVDEACQAERAEPPTPESTVELVKEMKEVPGVVLSSTLVAASNKHGMLADRKDGGDFSGKVEQQGAWDHYKSLSEEELCPKPRLPGQKPKKVPYMGAPSEGCAGLDGLGLCCAGL